jgi:arsenate reductase (thioredoxin)
LNVYFVCIGNAGRSQMAQAFAARVGHGARSAGSHPETELHPEVVEAMDEVGIDLRGRSPKPIDRADLEWADVIVTMGSRDACPVLPGKHYVDWQLQDPAGMPIEVVRKIRDEIEQRVRGLESASDASVRG